MQKELIEFIAKALVDDASAVTVNETEGEKGTVLELKVSEADIGKVIGKQGRIAKAMRTILNATAGKTGKKYSLEILD
ncbi:MAG: KH domain-containing protein [Treponemataceae bacterium]